MEVASAERLIADSKLESEAVKRAMASDVVHLGKLIRAIRDRMAGTGRVGKESQKAMNAAVSNRRRLLETLKCTGEKDDDPLAGFASNEKPEEIPAPEAPVSPEDLLS